ncbi:hypothetical protein PAPHI01_0894 [Pancytospora philotis]|nr:hypothetical protein PAPHI01_0894 [Pancytospora philotis]
MLLSLLKSGSASNSETIKLIESEVERLVAAPTLAELAEFLETNDATCVMYACKIIELRALRGVHSRSLAPEIEFVTCLIRQNQGYHACKVYALLGLFCWPNAMPGFLNEISGMLGTKAGYQTLLLFLEQLNCNTNIDEKRRAELKTGMGMVMGGLMQQFSDGFAGFIIPIFTQLLKVMPLNYDWSIVLRCSADYPMEAIDFLTDAASLIDPSKIVDTLAVLPPSALMLQTVSSLKAKDMEPVYIYALRCLSEDTDCFIFALDFWQRVFAKAGHEAILAPVLLAVSQTYAEIDESAREDAESYFFGFWTVVAKNYPAVGTDFVRSNAQALPARVVVSFLNKIARTDAYMLNFTFGIPYLDAYVAYLTGSPAAPSLIGTLDLQEKDNIKLVLLILQKYSLPEEQIRTLLGLCPANLASSSELRVECLSRLGMQSDFSAEWTMPMVIEYYYWLKKDKAHYSKYRESFYGLFLRSAPFDRCFSILQMLGDVPGHILQHIYDGLAKYPFIELCCFNNDMLCYLGSEIQNPFVQLEVQRFVQEWTKITSHVEYYQALKSLLNIFSGKMEQPGMADLLLDLLVIDYSPTVNKICAIFTAYKGLYNTQKAVYFFGVAYNASSLEGSRAQLVSALTACLFAADGPDAFSAILSLPVEKCREVRQQMEKANKKTAQNMVRALIKDFRGKAFRHMFASDLKVTKQNFLNSTKPAEVDSD